MKTFDLIDSATFGYKTVWQERAYLFKLAAVPVFIKLVCTVVVFAFGYESDYLRQGLITLPAAFAEGWLLAQFLRTLLLLERWPIMLGGHVSDAQMSALLIRARGIMSATIMFALITFLAYGVKELYAWTANQVVHVISTDPAKPSPGADPSVEPGNPLLFIPAVFMIYASIWLFRYLWLYIPVAVLMPVGEFLKKLGGFMASIRMMGVFLVAMVPCLILGIVLSNVITAIVGGADTDIGRFAMVIISVLIETLISLLTTASMAYALRHIVPKHPAALPDLDKAP